MSLWSDEVDEFTQPAAVILNSTFTSMPETVAYHYPLFPFRYFIWDRWQSIDRISRIRAPIIIFHGTDDQMIPIAHGRELSQASANSRFIEIKGGSHNEIPIHRLRKELGTIRVLMIENESIGD